MKHLIHYYKIVNKAEFLVFQSEKFKIMVISILKQVSILQVGFSLIATVNRAREVTHDRQEDVSALSNL